MSDYNHDVSEYMSDLEFDEEDFRSTEDRLNTINHLKGKYGNTIEEILRYKEEKKLIWKNWWIMMPICRN